MNQRILLTSQFPDISGDFVITEHLQKLIDRALSYLKAGFPVHFQGPSGTGKTALAFYLARRLDRPVMPIHGDSELDSGDIVGGPSGYSHTLYIDNFVHSVLKRKEEWERQWIVGRLTMACREGMTLVYDEFTRSHPEVNNVLLSVLEEGVLQLPGVKAGEKYVRVHPGFRAIFTSNPEEYAGVYKSQDALRDRMITIELGQMDLETEIRITARRSGLAEDQATVVVNVVRNFAGAFPGFTSTQRRSIMIAKLVREQALPFESPLFQEVCLDVLGSEVTRKNGNPVPREVLEKKMAAVIAGVLSPEGRQEDEPSYRGFRFGGFIK